MSTTGSRVVDQDLQLSHSGGLTDRSKRSLMTPAVPAIEVGQLIIEEIQCIFDSVKTHEIFDNLIIVHHCILISQTLDLIIQILS